MAPMTMTEPELLVEHRDQVLWLRINRPQRRNAVNDSVLAGLAAALEEVRREPGVRVVVLTGTGDKAFCAGGDLARDKSDQVLRPSTAEPRLPAANLMRLARASPVPLVARVNGACLAGGMGLLAMCSLAVAADHATFGLPEVKIGLFPFQVLASLRPLLAPRDLAQLCLTGDAVDAATARAMGLVNTVVPAGELDAEVDALVARLVRASPSALRRGLYTLRAIEDMTFEQAIAFGESQLGLAAMTEDATEGLTAFAEKRKPTWTGR